MTFAELPPSSSLAPIWIGAVTVPVIEHDHRSWLEEVTRERENGYGGFVEIAIDVDNGCFLREAPSGLGGKGLVVEALDRGEALARDAVAKACRDEKPLPHGGSAFLPSLLLVNLPKLWESLERVEKEEVPVEEMAERVPSVPSGSGPAAAELHVVTVHRSADVMKARDCNKHLAPPFCLDGRVFTSQPALAITEPPQPDAQRSFDLLWKKSGKHHRTMLAQCRANGDSRS